GADGGNGGATGTPGGAGRGRDGGAGGTVGVLDDDAAVGGRGASGGASFGWFDTGQATQTFDSAEFIEGVAGAGGRGSTEGETGLEANSNVDAEG
ncbi:MAG: PE-PGRS family protein, partial [Ilumatobacter sp.]